MKHIMYNFQIRKQKKYLSVHSQGSATVETVWQLLRKVNTVTI